MIIMINVIANHIRYIIQGSFQWGFDIIILNAHAMMKWCC